MRFGSDVKCGLPSPLVGMMSVGWPPLAGIETKSAAAGPRNAPRRVLQLARRAAHRDQPVTRGRPRDLRVEARVLG